MPAPTKSSNLDDSLIRPDTFWELIEKLLIHKTLDEQTHRRHNASLNRNCKNIYLGVPHEATMPPPTKSSTLDDSLIRPDTFWELIEKLLIHKTLDEKTRRRHNASLSALCRGHALPRLPRANSAKKTLKVKPLQGIIQKAEQVNQKSVPKSKSHCFDCEDKHRSDRAQTDNEEQRNLSANHAPLLNNAKEAKSESRLTEHDIVYLKPNKGTNVPASERLWRYAIKNRKREYGMLLMAEANEDTHVEPDIRSNEAIYNGLRTRSDERKQGRKERRAHARERQITRRHSCGHIQQIQNEKQAQKASNAAAKLKRTPSFQSQHQLTTQKTEKRQAKPKLQQLPKPELKHSQPSTPEPKKPYSTKMRQQTSSPELKTTYQSASSSKPHQLPESGLVINQSAMSSTSPTMHQGVKKKDGGVARSKSSQDEMLAPWGEEDAWADLTRQTSSKSKEKFESKRAQYNSVIKRRLSCGNQLELFNKEMVTRKTGNTRSVLSKDTRRRYGELKTEYLGLCYQESTLRHQIALLHAEIYMMQNKGFHKTPATINTIKLDSRPLHRSQSNQQQAAVTSSCHVNADGHVVDEGATLPVFPCLRAPRPLITCQQSKLHADKQTDKADRKRSAGETDRKIDESEVDISTRFGLPSVSMLGSPGSKSCSVYRINPNMIQQPREPVTLPERKVDKLAHRLPRMASAETLAIRLHSLQC